MVILYLLLVYLSIGMVFGLVFLVWLIHQLDEGAEGSSWKFKLLIFPGCVVFWPVLLKKYLNASKTKTYD